MGIPWSAEVVVGEVEGYCDERFIEVKRQFAAQRLAQLCVYVEGQMVVRKIFFQFEINDFFYEISVRSTFGRMEAWSPIVRLPSPPSFLGALDRKSRNSLKEPELVRSGKSLESLAFAMLYDQGHIKFTDRLAKDIILPCNDINSQSETSNTWYRLLVNT